MTTLRFPPTPHSPDKDPGVKLPRFVSWVWNNLHSHSLTVIPRGAWMVAVVSCTWRSSVVCMVQL